jgi:hypothetical protein
MKEFHNFSEKTSENPAFEFGMKRQAVSKKVSLVGTYYIEEQLEIAPFDLKTGLHSFQQKKRNCSEICLNKEHQTFSGLCYSLIF